MGGSCGAGDEVVDVVVVMMGSSVAIGSLLVSVTSSGVAVVGTVVVGSVVVEVD